MDPPEAEAEATIDRAIDDTRSAMRDFVPAYGAMDQGNVNHTILYVSTRFREGWPTCARPDYSIVSKAG